MKTYEVTGVNPVVIDKTEHLPGAKFSATLTPELEAFLTQCGALSVVAKKAQPIASGKE